MKIGITGCAGRMGQALVRLVAATDGCVLAAASERLGSEMIGKDAGIVAGLAEKLGIMVSDNVEQVFSSSGVVIDFTSPESSLVHAKMAAKHKKPLVIGTTGFSEAQKKQLQDYAKQAPILWSPNMSMGVALLCQLVGQAAAALGEEFDIEIVEMHHRQKVDAPSGTALALGEAAARGRNVNLTDKKVTGREGRAEARKKGDIGFASLRGGNVVGDHTVIFAGADERIELTHKAASRDIFAQGALKAAFWLKDKPAGFYSLSNLMVISGLYHK